MSGHLDGPPPGPPDPPYIEGDLGAPSAEEFVHKRRSARAMSTTPDERLREAGERLAQAVARVCGEGHPALGMWRVALAAADREAPERCASCGGPDGHLGACTTWTPPVSDEQEVPDA